MTEQIEAEVEKAPRRPHRTSPYERWTVYVYDSLGDYWWARRVHATAADAETTAAMTAAPAVIVHIHIPAMDY